MAVCFCVSSFAQGKEKKRLLTEIPFRTFTGGIILFQARLDTNSRPLNFILDSGSGGLSLDSATAVELNLPQRQTDTLVSGIGGRKKVAFSFNRTLHFPKLAVDSMSFYINDYSILTHIYGQKIDGIIGYGLLRKFVINIDFDTGAMRIYSPGKMQYSGGGTTLRPRINYLAVQPLTVRDHRTVPYNFYLDTGAGLCMLLSEQFANDSSIVVPSRKFVKTQSEGLGGRIHMRLTVVRQVKLAKYKFKNVPVYLYSDSLNIMSYPFTGGVAGNDLLRRFNLTFNYAQGEVHITPNKSFNEEFDYAYTGLLIVDLATGIFVDDIVEESPAAKSGLRLGDEIVGINTNFSSNITSYNRMLQRAKETITIMVRRNDELLSFLLKPESILR